MQTEAKTLSIMNYLIFTGSIHDILSIEKKIIVNTINVHSYCVAKNDHVFMVALQKSDVLLPDGIGIVLAAMLLNGEKIQQITGPQIHYNLLKKLNSEKKSCFYLGSSEKTLRLIENRLHEEYPVIRAGFYSPPYRDNFLDEENQDMIKIVNDFKPDVLFVGMTAPKQEKWVFLNNQHLDAKLICSIGAEFDFYAGTVKRPHFIFFRLGLVWVVRFLLEPKRLWKRHFISIPCFLLEVLLYKVGLKHSK